MVLYAMVTYLQTFGKLNQESDKMNMFATNYLTYISHFKSKGIEEEIISIFFLHNPMYLNIVQ